MRRSFIQLRALPVARRISDFACGYVRADDIDTVPESGPHVHRSYDKRSGFRAIRTADRGLARSGVAGCVLLISQSRRSRGHRESETARATGRAHSGAVAGAGVPRRARSIRPVTYPVTVTPTRPAAAAARPGAGRRRLDNAPGNPWHGHLETRPHEQCFFVSFYSSNSL